MPPTLPLTKDSQLLLFLLVLRTVLVLSKEIRDTARGGEGAEERRVSFPELGAPPPLFISSAPLSCSLLHRNKSLV